MFLCDKMIKLKSALNKLQNFFHSWKIITITFINQQFSQRGTLYLLMRTGYTQVIWQLQAQKNLFGDNGRSLFQQGQVLSCHPENYECLIPSFILRSHEFPVKHLYQICVTDSQMYKSYPAFAVTGELLTQMWSKFSQQQKTAAHTEMQSRVIFPQSLLGVQCNCPTRNCRK